MQHIGLVGVIVLAAAVTGVTVGASTLAAGQTSETMLESVLDGPAENESRAAWAVDGVADGAAGLFGGLEGGRQRTAWTLFNTLGVGEEPANASSTADEVASIWNANNETLDAYGNERRDWEQNRTVEITWHVDGETATRYLLANESNGSVSTAMVTETARTPDEDVDVCRYAAEESPDELEHFITEYAEPGEDIDAGYKGRLGGKYGDDVDASLYPTSGDCDGSNASNLVTPSTVGGVAVSEVHIHG